MTRGEVEERLERFLALIDQQQGLREELLQLKMWGKRATEDAVADRLGRQAEMIEEIERLRNEEMLPILEELAAFISTVKLDGVAS
ncbi:hypothetical protein IV102_06230 [bacterium]|nr:hypothetical protein [bacterium]